MLGWEWVDLWGPSHSSSFPIRLYACISTIPPMHIKETLPSGPEFIKPFTDLLCKEFLKTIVLVFSVFPNAKVWFWVRDYENKNSRSSQFRELEMHHHNRCGPTSIYWTLSMCQGLQIKITLRQIALGCTYDSACSLEESPRATFGISTPALWARPCTWELGTLLLWVDSMLPLGEVAHGHSPCRGDRGLNQAVHKY